MDPPRWSGRAPDRRLPRTRGDGPRAPGAAVFLAEASPHTRGWPRSPQRKKGTDRGFPAHAGMDPCWPRRSRGRCRLPRTRGDGPASVRSARWTVRASPHTRGWTRGRLDGIGDVYGFPAHAGMDRSTNRKRADWTWLPRTRGDGPVSMSSVHPLMVASPHTRGWTRQLELAPACRLGFPAHAGMDPSAPSARPPSTRLPRTRGDGPQRLAGGGTYQWASPHTRGWTRPAGRGGPPTGGFPAHAGMDRRPRRPRRPRGRLPRTRGDGPRYASASMRRLVASPHTRGWTLRPGADDARRGGFPAHAGMDRG